MKFLLFVLLVGVVVHTGEAVILSDTPSEEFQTPEGMELVRRNNALHKARDNLFKEYQQVKLKGYAVTNEEDENTVYKQMLAINAVLEQIQVDADKLDADIDMYLSRL